jgi:hypothetical protein
MTNGSARKSMTVVDQDSAHEKWNLNKIVARVSDFSYVYIASAESKTAAAMATASETVTLLNT